MSNVPHSLDVRKLSRMFFGSYSACAREILLATVAHLDRDTRRIIDDRVRVLRCRDNQTHRHHKNVYSQGSALKVTGEHCPAPPGTGFGGVRPLPGTILPHFY